MKLFTAAALALACTLAPIAAQAQTAPATPTNKADCEKAKMTWDAKGGKDGKGACLAAPAKTDAVKK